MPARPKNRLLEHGWLYVPAASGPIGGGMIKLGGGNTFAAVAVATTPYALFGLMYLVFVIGYVTAVARYVWSGPEGQEAMGQLITVSTNAIVSILTLTRAQTASARAREAQEPNPEVMLHGSATNPSRSTTKAPTT